MAFVTLDSNGNVTGVFMNPQPQLEGFTTIADDDARITSFMNPPSLQMQIQLGKGLTIASQATPGINGTYALDDVTMSQIGAVARDAAAGLGLPGGSDSFTYPDINGNPKTFSSTTIQILYKAMRDYIYAVQSIAAQGSTTWPSNSVSVT